jgi:tRNA(fMet)-specific endonuclease VapC
MLTRECCRLKTSIYERVAGLARHIVSHVMRNPAGRAGQRLAEYEFGQVGISTIVLSELLFGVEKSGSFSLRLSLDFLVSRIVLLPFDDKAAASYGKVRSALERAGTPIGPHDTFIAAHALALDLTLVTDLRPLAA